MLRINGPGHSILALQWVQFLIPFFTSLFLYFLSPSTPVGQLLSHPIPCYHFVASVTHAWAVPWHLPSAKLLQ